MNNQKERGEKGTYDRLVSIVTTVHSNVEVVVVLLHTELEVERGGVGSEDELRTCSIGSTPAVVEGTVGLEGEVVSGAEGDVGDGPGVEDGVAVRSAGEDARVWGVRLAHCEPNVRSDDVDGGRERRKKVRTEEERLGGVVVVDVEYGIRDDAHTVGVVDRVDWQSVSHCVIEDVKRANAPTVWMLPSRSSAMPTAFRVPKLRITVRPRASEPQ